jgi:hypothetical protein
MRTPEGHELVSQLTEKGRERLRTRTGVDQSGVGKADGVDR